MSQYVFMTVEGVLVEGMDIKTGLPSQNGHMLFDALKISYSVVLITQYDQELVDTWLRKEGIRGYANLFAYDYATLPVTAWKARKVRDFQRNSVPVAWFIDSDPAAITSVFLEGVPTMLVSSPHFVRPEFRPGQEHKVRRWDELVTTIETEQMFRNSKESS